MREKKEFSVNQDLLMKANHIADTFSMFTEGINVLFLIHRSKEGAKSANNDKLKKRISTDKESFIKILYELLVEKERLDIPELRIYSSVNPRNIKKAIRKFRQEQLDNEYQNIELYDSFYLDIKNRFISALMSPSSSSSSMFLVDIDERHEQEEILKKISEKGLNEFIVKQYATKNGWHIIMKPFNPALLDEYTDRIKKDALLLLNF